MDMYESIKSPAVRLLLSAHHHLLPRIVYLWNLLAAMETFLPGDGQQNYQYAQPDSEIFPMQGMDFFLF